MWIHKNDNENKNLYILKTHLPYFILDNSLSVYHLQWALWFPWRHGLPSRPQNMMCTFQFPTCLLPCSPSNAFSLPIWLFPSKIKFHFLGIFLLVTSPQNFHSYHFTFIHHLPQLWHLQANFCLPPLHPVGVVGKHHCDLHFIDVETVALRLREKVLSNHLSPLALRVSAISYCSLLFRLKMEFWQMIQAQSPKPYILHHKQLQGHSWA